MRRIGLFTLLSSLLLLSILLLMQAGLASAQTVSFESLVKGKILRPLGCPDGAYLCGDAVIFGL